MANPGAEHILKNTSATLEIVFSAGDADGDVTVTITKGDGTVLVAAGATTNEAEAGRYTYLLAPQADVDSLTVVWEGSWTGVAQSITTYAEIVGASLFLISGLRTFGDRQLSSEAKYPDVAIREARARIADGFEETCGVAFIPRYARAEIDGGDWDTLLAPHRRINRIFAVSIDDMALTSEEIDAIKVYPEGRLFRETCWPRGQRNVVLSYEHGWPEPPSEIRRVAMTMARYELVSNDVSDRMEVLTNELGTVRLSIPGRGRPSGIPLVDATLARYDENDLLGV